MRTNYNVYCIRPQVLLHLYLFNLMVYIFVILASCYSTFCSSQRFVIQRFEKRHFDNRPPYWRPFYITQKCRTNNYLFTLREDLPQRIIKCLDIFLMKFHHDRRKSARLIMLLRFILIPWKQILGILGWLLNYLLAAYLQLKINEDLKLSIKKLSTISDFFKTPTRRLTVLSHTLCKKNVGKISSQP